MSRSDRAYDFTPCTCATDTEGECRCMDAGEHQWGEDLVCAKKGCTQDWLTHQTVPADCTGTSIWNIGRVRAREIASREFRRYCVVVLTLGGWTRPEIGRVVKASKGTITRDLKIMGVVPVYTKGSRSCSRGTRGVEDEPAEWAPLAHPRVGRDQTSDPSRVCEDRAGATIAA